MFHTIKTKISEIMEQLKNKTLQFTSTLQLKLRKLYAAQFKSCLDILKGVVDLIQSATMTGVEIQTRFPALFGWLTDSVVEVCGMTAALVGLFNRFPAQEIGKISESGSTASSSKESSSNNRSERKKNISSLIFLFLQVGFVIRNSPAFSGVSSSGSGSGITSKIGVQSMTS
jgi:hypothetical protein